MQRGEITEARIDESGKKILSYKARWLKNFVVGDEAEFGGEVHKKVVQRVTKGG